MTAKNIREQVVARFEDEPGLWDSQKAKADNALRFWNTFFALRHGDDNDQTLDEPSLARLLCIIRAVSWVESKHGTGTGNQPARDPVQCGNPNDTFWQELIAPDGTVVDRFVGGPGAPNFDANKLPAAMESNDQFPAEAKLSQLGNTSLGHNDGAFNSTMSYSWGIIYLIHRTNKHPDLGSSARTFKCGDLSRDRLVKGAIAYNGGGDPEYGTKVNTALDMIGCLG